MNNKKVAIIGCGNLGMSILQGLIDDRSYPSANIIATERNIQDIAHVQELGVKVTSDNIAATKEADILIVAVKPYNIIPVLQELKDHRNY